MSRGRRFLLSSAALLAMLFAGLMFVVHSTGFAAWLLPRVLPAGATVAVMRGSIATGLTLEGLEMPGLRVSRMSLAADFSRTLTGTPTLALLDAEGIRFDPGAWPRSTAVQPEPAASPWPASLPRFAAGPLALRNLEIAGEQPIQIDSARWEAIESRGPALELSDLHVEGPALSVHLDGTLGWSEASALSGTFRYRDYAGALELSGVPTDAAVALTLQSPLAAELSGQIRGGPQAPTAALRLRFPEPADPNAAWAPLKPLMPFAADLQLSGDPANLAIDGLLTVQGQVLRLDGTRLSGLTERLRLAPLRIGLGSGRLQIDGDWPLADGQADGQLRLQAQDLGWPGAPLALSTLDAELRGRNDALDFAVVAGAKSPASEAIPARLQGRWADGALSVQSLTLADDAVQGEASWVPASGSLTAVLTLAALDLSAIWPEHPSRLTGSLSLRGAPGDWQLAVQALDGEWRHLPVNLRGDVSWDGVGLPAGTLDARLDGHALRLRPIEAGHEASLQLGSLDAFLPGASVVGRIEVQQRGERLDWQVAVESAAIPMSEQVLELGGLDGRGQLRIADVLEGELQVQLASLESAGTRYGPVVLGLSGTRAAHRFELAGSAPQGRVDLQLEGGFQLKGWSGAVAALSLQPAGLAGPPLALDGRMPLSLDAGRLDLQRACLRRLSASICLDGGLDTVGTAAGALRLTLAGFDLDTLPRAEDAGWQVGGVLEGEAAVTLAGPTVATISAELAAPSVRVSVERDEGERSLVFDDLRLRADGTPGALAIRAQTVLQDAGPLDLRLDGLGGANLSGALEVDFDRLQVLNGWTPEVVNPEGRLQGRLTLAGTPEALDLGGALTLAALRTELPGAGLKVRDGQMTLEFPAPGVAALSGYLDTGEGRLALESQASRDAEGKPALTARISGERVLVADLPNVRLLASPSVELQTREGVLVASGTLGLPEGRIDLERFEPGVAASSDVVVLDRPVAAPAPVRTDIRYTMGPALQLKGFGLDATLRGGLRIRSRPGRPVTASGTLDLAGGYRAYGQKLTIDRGRLLWANAPIGNPGFDFSAYRTIDQLKAGVRVRGSASAPELTVYTDPPREASDALSWLVLGRPLSSASGNDGQQLSAAAGALGSVGGALIGATIGQRLGVEINVESSAELGGSPAFTVGKMLSPKLFVGFGRSLFDSAQLVIVRYRLTEHYELEALSGRESKIGANYRIER